MLEAIGSSAKFCQDNVTPVYCGQSTGQVYLRQKDVRRVPRTLRYFVSSRMTRSKVVSVCIVRVNDLQVAGKPSDVTPILKNLATKVKLQVEGPFLTESDYKKGYSTYCTSSVRFLTRKYSFEHGKLFVRPDSK